MSVAVSAWMCCSVRLYLQLFVGRIMSYLRYLCFSAYSGVQHIFCCVFVCFSSSCVPMLLVSLDCPVFNAPSVFSNVYLLRQFDFRNLLCVNIFLHESSFKSLSVADKTTVSLSCSPILQLSTFAYFGLCSTNKL